MPSFFFYADNGVVASPDPVWLQTAFNTPTGIFERVGLWKNVQKIVGIIFQPLRAVGIQAYKAYKCQMTGDGRGYQERQ